MGQRGRTQRRICRRTLNRTGAGRLYKFPLYLCPIYFNPAALVITGAVFFCPDRSRYRPPPWWIHPSPRPPAAAPPGACMGQCARANGTRPKIETAIKAIYSPVVGFRLPGYTLHRQPPKHATEARKRPTKQAPRVPVSCQNWDTPRPGAGNPPRASAARSHSVLENVRNPPGFIIGNLTGLSFGFHSRKP